MLIDLNISTPRGDIFAKCAGPDSGELVLCLHGWSQRNGWHTWEPLLEPLAVGGFFVVSVDMPGWGKSPAWDVDMSRPVEAVAVVKEIAASLSRDELVLLGKSWGGAVAIECALDPRLSVSRLILSAPAYGDFGRLRALRQPVLLVWAEDDPVIPIRAAATIQNQIRDCRLVVYPGGGHSAAPKNAVEFSPVALDFLVGKVKIDRYNDPQTGNIDE